MKRLLLLSVLLIMATVAFAQSGLQGLYYGEEFSLGKKNLEAKGFRMIKSKPVLREFALGEPTSVYLVELFVNPATNRIVGWLMRYMDTMTDEEQMAVLNECVELHGEEYLYKPETKMVNWSLDDTKSLILLLDDNERLTMATYFDAAYAEIFDKAEYR